MEVSIALLPCRKQETIMKGIKTAVKTEWKNYALGNSRGPIRIDNSCIYFKGFSVGDYLFLSYHVKWKGVDWGKRKKSSAIFQLSDALGYHFVGFSTDSSEGERDVTIKPFELKDYSSYYGVKLTETTNNYRYRHW